jgi:hypothetical protein
MRFFMVFQHFRTSLRRNSVLPAAGAAVLISALAACDRMPLTAPSGTAITLVATTNLLPVNGSTDITAILIEGGQGTSTGNNPPATNTGVGTPVHNGTLVTFTTSLGRIEPAEARTTNGRATVKLYGDGRSGTATITAFSGAATKTLEVAIGAAGATRVVVTANPQALAWNGGTTTVSARVEDEQGNGLLGVPVSFGTTAGTLTPNSAVTDSNGIARSSLTTTAAATVTANAGAASGEVDITLQARTDLTITPPTGAISIGVPAAFTFGVSGTGTSINNAVVDWGDGSSTSLGSLTGNRTVTHLFDDTGSVRVTLSGDDASNVRASVSTEVVVVPMTITVAVAPASPTAGSAATFTATVLPAGAAIERYEWTIEGQTRVTSGAQISHVFSSPGTHTVTVHAVPVRGPSATAIIQVAVQ